VTVAVGLDVAMLAARTGHDADVLARVLLDEVRLGRVVHDGDGFRLDLDHVEPTLVRAFRSFPEFPAPETTPPEAAGRSTTMTTTKTVRVKAAELRRLHLHRYAALVRPLDYDERGRLEDSIRHGYDDSHPIVVWARTGEIVDGRNRRDVAVGLGLADVPVVEREFADDAEVAAYVLAANLARRHLTAKERRELAGRLVVNGTSTRRAAKTAGVSEATARRAAADARAGASPDAPTSERVTGSDGKSYPATKPRAAKPQAAKRKAKPITRLRLTPEQREFGSNLTRMAVCADDVLAPVRALGAGLLDVDDERRSAWLEHVATIERVTDSLRDLVASVGSPTT
jgi:ParB-like chromosome segregation protein Spo0J